MKSVKAEKVHTVSVLLVDDDPIVQFSHQLMLKSQNCLVSTASTGRDALVEIDANDFDILFIDIGLPDLDGLEVIKAVRARCDEKSTIKIVAITGNTTSKLKQDCYAAGVNVYLIKPVLQEKILEFVGAFKA